MYIRGLAYYPPSCQKPQKKSDIFDTDESDDITTEYYFRYVLNEAGEIDDLILLKKQDVYTINGEPVDGSEWYGWQD